MRIRFDNKEISKLASDLNGAGRRAESRCKTIVKRTSNGTVTAAQRVVPVDTGALKNSIHSDLAPDGLGFEAGSELGYSGWVEFGTTRMAPQPYMVPSFEAQVAAAMPAFTAATDPWPSARNG